MSNEYIKSMRGTVMDAKEFRNFVIEIFCNTGRNYTATAERIGTSAPTIRRVAHHGKDSDVLRKILDIRKSDRTRY